MAPAHCGIVEMTPPPMSSIEFAMTREEVMCAGSSGAYDAGHDSRAAEPHMADAVQEIVTGNGRAHGDYLIVCQATSDENGVLYSWRWAWSPKAPEHVGRAED